MIKKIITDSTFDIKKLFQVYSNNIAIETTEKNISYGELKSKILNVINFLEESGIKPGQKVAIYKENSIHHIVLFLVSWVMKFLYVPLNFKTPIDEAISNLELDILFCDSIKEHAGVRVFKTDELDKEVTAKYADLHLKIGVEAMTELGDMGEQIKHFSY